MTDQTQTVGFCTGCGHRFTRSSAFCPQCGTATHAVVRGEAATADPAWAVRPAGTSPAPLPAPGQGGAPFSPAVAVGSSQLALPLRSEPAPVPAGAPAASVAARLIANVIDAGLVLVPTTVAVIAVSVLSAISDSTMLIQLLLYFVLMVSVVAYAVVYAGRGGTIGKRLMGVRIVDIDTGGWIGPGRALLRHIVLGLESVPCYLGYLSPFLDRSGQLRGWHDMAARDRVVAVDREPLVQAWRP